MKDYHFERAYPAHDHSPLIIGLGVFLLAIVLVCAAFYCGERSGYQLGHFDAQNGVSMGGAQ